MLKPADVKSSKWLWIAYAIVGLVFGGMIVSICFTVNMLAKSFYAFNLLPELITLILLIACMVLLVFGLIPMLNYLYFANDTEFMMSLPVSPAAVYFAKMSVVYITEMALSVIIALPCLITVGATLSLGVGYYFVILLATLLVPAIPLVLVSVLAIPLMYIVSFFRRKGALTSIVLIVLFAAIFAAYMAVISGLETTMADGETIEFEVLIEKFSAAIKGVCRFLVPLLAVSRIATGATVTLFGETSVAAAAAINLAVFLGVIVLTAFLAMLVSSAVYKKGARSMLEGGKSAKEGATEFKGASSAFSALVKKEWRELVRTPAFAFQCLSGILICPLLLVFMSTTMNAGVTAGADGEIMTAADIRVFNLIMSFVMILLVGVMGMSLNVGAATTISREGKNFYIMKTMPVPVKTQIQAKMVLYLIISSATIVVSQIIASVLFFNAVNMICGMIFLLIYNYGYNCFCIYMDINKPKLNWVTHNEAVKNNKNATLAMLINMAVFIVMAIVPILAFVLIPVQAAAMAVLWTVLILIAIAVAVIFHTLLFNNAERLLNRINA